MDAGLKNLELTEQIRKRVLSALSFVFFFVAFALGAFNIVYHGSYVFGAFELIYSAFSLYVFIKYRKRHCPRQLIFFYLLWVTAIILVGTSTVPISNLLFLWGLFLPTVAYLLLGKSLGFRLAFIVFTTQTAVLAFRFNSETLLSIAPVMVNFVTCYLSIWCISHYFELSRAKAHESLARLAYTDTLTTTNNRLAFVTTFGSYANNYLLMLDIDNFKSINDEFGHDTGDLALTLICDRLKEEVGPSRVFRLGGEEFCVWLNANNATCALNEANRLRNAVSKIEINIDNQRISLTFSGGLVSHKNKMTKSELLKRADELLYQAKSAGKDRVVCAESEPSLPPT